MKKEIRDFDVLTRKFLNKEYFIVKLGSKKKLPEMYPGQFVQVMVMKKDYKTFLRRPFSVHNVNEKENTMDLLIQIVGNGTRSLSDLQEGEKINIILPLGNHYNLPKKRSSEVLLVGGGCGVAPLLFLAKYLNKNGHKPHILMGGRSKEHIIEEDKYIKYGELYITTEDGSYGEKGYVIHHSVLKDPVFTKIYTCGPDLMMKAIAKYAKRRNIECEVSLENVMACGIGACLCCVEDTVRGNVCTCTEGPVFNINELKWQI